MKFNLNASSSFGRRLVVPAVAAGLVFAGAAPRAFGQSITGFTYNGVAYTSYQATEYLETPQGSDGTAAMAAYGVNYATVLATQYVQTSTSNTIAANGSTPTDAAVVAAITNLQNAGIKVALKPQVDSLDQIWRGQFEPTNTAAWFASYQTFIVHYATIAQAQGVDLFVVGCEFATLSGSKYQSNWETIIAAVRAVYTGPITYAANATSAGDEFTSVSFWSKLDLLGADGYFPLTNRPNPTLTQLENAWTIASDNKNGFAPATALENFQSSYPTMPLIFTEIGYTSTAGTNEAPYNYTPTGAFDPTEQANCYEAFFEVFSKDTTWMKGVFWWDWSVSAPGTDDTGYSPQNKPAGDVLAQWYGGENFTLAPSPAALSVTQGASANDTITVTNGNGFTGVVTLTVSGLPSGVTEAEVNAPIPGQTVLGFTASSTAAAGTFPVTVTGTSASGSLTSFTTIALTVNSLPGFTLAPSAHALSVPQGSSGTDTITVTDVGGFTGSVTLSASGLPSGVTASFATNPATGSSVLTLTASSTATTGAATVTITGSSGTLTASTTIALTVTAPSFTLSASPATVTIVQGTISGISSSSINVTDVNGFTGAVTLAATGLPSGVTANFGTNPTTGSSSLTLVASSTATVGQATVTITGTSGSVTASTPIALTVNPAPSFTLSASPATLPVTQGGSGTSNIMVAAANGFNEPVSLTASGLPTGVTAAFATNPTSGTSVLTLTASSTAATGPATVTILGSAPTQGGVSCGLPCNVTESTTIALTITSASSFTLAASAPTLSITQGSSGTSTISVAGAGGFNGAVTLAASGLPNGVTAGFATNPTTGSSVLTLTASSSATTGTSPVTITGSSGSLTASTLISLTVTAVPVQSFTISAAPSTLAVSAGTPVNSTITVTPSGGFTGSVTLTAAITSSPTGVTDPPTMSFGSTSPVTISGSGAGQATLTFSTTGPTGICGSSYLLNRGVPWYTAGGTALSFILLFGIPGRRRNRQKMLGIVALCIVLAGGMTACGGSSGNKNVCAPAATGGTTGGTYTVTVTATSGTVTATVPVTFNVQ